MIETFNFSNIEASPIGECQLVSDPGYSHEVDASADHHRRYEGSKDCKHEDGTEVLKEISLEQNR